MEPFSIDPDTTMGAVRLIVRDLERMRGFYVDRLGFRAVEQADGAVALTADGKTPILVLHGQPDAKSKPLRATGLYHAAIRVPDRVELAKFLLQLIVSETPLQGASDHLVSEALYLADPEGNGLEFYRDRPGEEWPREKDGSYRLAVDPLDVEDLLDELNDDAAEWGGLHPDTAMGHVHLRVNFLDRAEAFYHGVLGFDVVAVYAGQAGFVSAGGYHHHIGYNVWAGVGVPPPPAGSTGLEYFTIQLPDQAALDQLTARIDAAGIEREATDAGMKLRDPAGNRMLLTMK